MRRIDEDFPPIFPSQVHHAHRRRAHSLRRHSSGRDAAHPAFFVATWAVTAMCSAFLSMSAMYLLNVSAWSPRAGYGVVAACGGCLLALANLAVMVGWFRWRNAAAKAGPLPRIIPESFICALCLLFAGAATLAVVEGEDLMHYGSGDYLRWIEATPDGKAIAVLGDIKSGSADRFESLLAGNPGVRAVYLLSMGGLADEARRISALIKDRGLDTIALGTCYSACTIIHAGGRMRLASEKGASLGYHSAGLLLFPESLTPLGTRARQIFIDAGYKKSYVDRIEAVPHRDLWEPDRDTLLAMGAIHGFVSVDDWLGLRWLLSPIGKSDDAYVDGGFAGKAFATAPHARSTLLSFARKAWQGTRSDARIKGYRSAYVGRVLAAGLSSDQTPERFVRKAAAFLLSGMQVARHGGSDGAVRCARIGAYGDFEEAKSASPYPPGSLTDPSDPWGALFGKAFVGLPPGWDASAAGLPSADDASTWILPRPMPKESCDSLVRWYAAAIDYDDADGIARLRRRFTAIAAGTAQPSHPDAGLQARKPD